MRIIAPKVILQDGKILTGSAVVIQDGKIVKIGLYYLLTYVCNTTSSNI